MLTKEEKEFIIELMDKLYVNDDIIYYFKSDEKKAKEIIRKLKK
jgi:hypothetical protein